LTATQTQRAAAVAALALAVLLLPAAAHAANDPITIANNIQTFMTGAWGKAIAAVAFGCIGLVS
jgi:type IV secretory pathway VirB2 component (pilin)